MLTAFLACAMMWCSCETEDSKNEEEQQRNDLSFLYIEASRTTTEGSLADKPDWAIRDKVVAVSTESAESTGIAGKIADIFKGSDSGRTIIYGAEDEEFISICFNGSAKSLPKDCRITQKMDEGAADLLVEFLSTGSLTEAMRNKFEFDALIIYKNAKDASALSSNFWFSYDCTINPSTFSVSNVDYIQGTFSARMRNKDGDSFVFSPGVFSCLAF